MSDPSQGGGTATLMPPGGTGVPPSAGGATTPPPPSGGVPVWVVIVVALAAAAIGASGAFLLGQADAAEQRVRFASLQSANAALEAKVAELDRIAAAGPSEAATTPPTGAGLATSSPDTRSKPPAPSTVKNLALITKVTWSASKGYQVTADYVQFLTGDAAADAAAAAGQESPPPNDYFIVNTSTKLRTLLLPKSTPVRVLDWSGASGTTLTKIPVGQFMDIMPGGTNPQEPWQSGYYWLTVKNGKTVLKVVQQYLP